MQRIMMDSWNGTMEENYKVENWSLVLGMVVTFGVFVTGTLGNLLTLVTLGHQFYLPKPVRSIKYMTPDTVLIMNLAIADLLYSAVNVPFIFVTYSRLYNGNDHPWEGEEQACRFSAFFRYTNAISEWATLGLMAVERCICIYKYRHNSRRPYRFFTCWKTVIYCAAIWLLAIVLHIPTYIEVYGKYGYNNITLKCDFVKTDNSNHLDPRTLFFAIEAVLPCILILIGYIVILLQVYSNNRRILTVFGSFTYQQKQLRQSRTTRVIVRLLMLFLICVIPICVYNIWLNGFQDDTGLKGTLPELGIFLYSVYFLQYCINNFIYVVSFEKYRCAYYQLLCCLLCREVKPSSPTRIAPLQSRQQVYTISQGHKPAAPEKQIIRTPSECEEERKTRNNHGYLQHRVSPTGSISSENSLEAEFSFTAPVVEPQVPGAQFDDGFYESQQCSGSLSTCSSRATLVLPVKRENSFKKKLRRTFSR